MDKEYIERKKVVEYLRSRAGTFYDDIGKSWSAGMDGAADKNVGHTIPVNDLYDEEGGEVL